MKIAIITNLFPPHIRGGAEIITQHIARGLRDHGHSIVVITTKPEGRLEREQEDGMTIYRFKPLNIFYYLEDYKYNKVVRLLWRIIDTFNVYSYFTVKKILKGEEVDVVISHNMVGLGLLAARAITAKHIHTLHDVQLVEPSGLLTYGNEQLQHGIVRSLYRYCTRRLFNRVDTVISPSQFLLNYHQENNFFKRSYKQVIPNPVVNVRTDHGKGYSREMIELLYIGQIETHKGIQFLVKAFTEYANDQMHLTIIGGGSKSNVIKELSAGDSRITFVGKVEHSKVSDYINQADYVVVPSLCYENSPTVIYEAFSCGVPVIASDIGGIPELISHKKNGFLFKPGDQVDLLHLLEYIGKESDQSYAYLSSHAVMTLKPLGIDDYLRVLEDFFRSHI